MLMELTGKGAAPPATPSRYQLGHLPSAPSLPSDSFSSRAARRPYAAWRASCSAAGVALVGARKSGKFTSSKSTSPMNLPRRARMVPLTLVVAWRSSSSCKMINKSSSQVPAKQRKCGCIVVDDVGAANRWTSANKRTRRAATGTRQMN